jgi:hypothetical protein
MGNELTERIVSANAPYVELLTPNGGETVDGKINVSWEASDADGDNLSFVVSYSQDNDISWHHLGFDLTETQLIVDTNQIPGGDEALFRVLASDGFNTNSDISDDTFTVVRHAPEVFIFTEDGTTVQSNQLLILSGNGYDQEDGILEGTSLEWSSNLEGFLGTGNLLQARLLEGQHIVTLTGRDSDNNEAEASIQIVVDGESDMIYLPLVLR